MPDLLSFVRALPKVQLHCHLEGTVQAQTFRELALLRGVQSARAAGPLEATYAFATFGRVPVDVSPRCARRWSSRRTTRGSRATMRRTRWRRTSAMAEIFISPSVWTFFHPDLNVGATVAAMRAEFEAVRRSHGLEVAFICDLTRNFGVERAFETAWTAVRLAESGLGVVGVGLGGDESKFPGAGLCRAI